MPNITYPLIFLLVYIILLFIVSWISSRKEKPEDFIIGQRKIGIIGTVASLSSGFRDGAGLAAWVIIVFAFGFGAMWLSIGLTLGYLVFAIVAPYINKLAHENDFVTFGDLIKYKIGNKTAILSSILIAATAFIYAGAQLFFSGSIFAALFSIPIMLGIIITAAIVGLYLIIGGYKTVIKTDILQWLFLLVIIILPFLLAKPDLSAESLKTFFSPGIQTMIGFFGISFLYTISAADVWQRLFSAKNGKIARKSFLYTALVAFIINAGVLLLALSIKAALPDVDPQNAFFALFSSSLISPIFISLLGVFVLAAIMSTMDTQIFLLSSTVTENLLSKGIIKNKKATVYISRLIIFISLLILIGLAATISDFIGFLFGAVSLVTILLPATILIMTKNSYKKGNADIIITIAILLTVPVYIAMFVLGAFSNVLYTIVPGAISLTLSIILYAGSKAFQRSY